MAFERKIMKARVEPNLAGMNMLIENAKRLATERHEGQFRKGEDKIPYMTHCEEVAGLVGSHGGDDCVIAAAWLHDAVEDTETTLDEIEALFGKKVADLVAEVTDDPAQAKEEQRAKQIETAPHKSPGAALIKAADQTSNRRSIALTPSYWSREKTLNYIAKAEAVVSGLPISASMKAKFDRAAGAARATAGA